MCVPTPAHPSHHQPRHPIFRWGIISPLLPAHVHFSWPIFANPPSNSKCSHCTVSTLYLRQSITNFAPPFFGVPLCPPLLELSLDCRCMGAISPQVAPQLGKLAQNCTKWAVLGPFVRCESRYQPWCSNSWLWYTPWLGTVRHMLRDTTNKGRMFAFNQTPRCGRANGSSAVRPQQVKGPTAVVASLNIVPPSCAEGDAPPLLSEPRQTHVTAASAGTSAYLSMPHHRTWEGPWTLVDCNGDRCSLEGVVHGHVWNTVDGVDGNIRSDEQVALLLCFKATPVRLGDIWHHF